MVGAIACFTPGCSNPVIGQCTGYKRTCGRFYCAIHSNNRLCGECAAQQAAEVAAAAHQAEIDRKYSEYCSAAFQVRRSTGLGCGSTTGIIFMIMFMTMLMALVVFILYIIALFNPSYSTYSHNGDNLLVGISIVAFIVAMIIMRQIGNRQQAEIDRAIAAVAAEKPGFAEFYADWLPKQQKADQEAAKAAGDEVMKRRLGIILGIGAAAASIAEDQQQHQYRRDVHDIADVAREIKRHG